MIILAVTAFRLSLHSHRERAALVEETARRAVLVANASYFLLQSILEDDDILQFRRQMEER